MEPSRECPKCAEHEKTIIRLRAQNRRLAEDLDEAESATRVYRWLVVKLSAAADEARDHH